MRKAVSLDELAHAPVDLKSDCLIEIRRIAYRQYEGINTHAEEGHESALPSLDINVAQAQNALRYKECKEASSEICDLRCDQRGLQISRMRHYGISEIYDRNDRKDERNVHVKMLVPDRDIDKCQKH
jgi:hypothetical protein